MHADSATTFVPSTSRDTKRHVIKADASIPLRLGNETGQKSRDIWACPHSTQIRAAFSADCSWLSVAVESPVGKRYCTDISAGQDF